VLIIQEGATKIQVLSFPSNAMPAPTEKTAHILGNKMGSV